MTTPMPNQTTGPRPSDKWIPWYFVAFFVVLAILDGIFVYLATSTHRGVVTEHAYQKGLNYNETIAAVEKQEALGWQSQIRLDRVAGQAPALVVELSDRDGQPITAADVRAQLFYVAEAGHDFDVTLTYMGGGQYREPIQFPRRGQWDVRINALWNQQSYQKRERLIIE